MRDEANLLKNLKGTKDFLPEEQLLRVKIKKVLEGVFERYGVQPLETPILCFSELLTSKYAGGEEIVKEMYQLKDNGERDLALRYDLTVPFVKVIGMNPLIRLPFKRYEIGKVFRDSPVRTGRLREFVQCDVDIVGVESVLAESELITLAVNAFRELDLEIIVEYNNRKLLTGVLRSIGVEVEKLNRVILSLDKLEKIGGKMVRIELEEADISESVINKIFESLKITRLSSFSEKFKDSLVETGVNELKELEGYLEALDIFENTQFNPSLARGLNFYTGTIYEVFLKDSPITSSVASGGRYDSIIGTFLESNKKYPAVGISFGLDVIYTVLSLENRKEMIGSNNTVLLIPLGVEKTALKIAEVLRRGGLPVALEMTGRKLKKALDYANKENYKYVMILGEEEVKKEVIQLKIMGTGSSEEFSYSDPNDFISFVSKKMH